MVADGQWGCDGLVGVVAVNVKVDVGGVPLLPRDPAQEDDLVLNHSTRSGNLRVGGWLRRP